MQGPAAATSLQKPLRKRLVQGHEVALTQWLIQMAPWSPLALAFATNQDHVTRV